jgi:hypothetical protein
MEKPKVFWPAVLGAAVAYWLLGAGWYSPALFANAWMAAIGKNEAQLKQISMVRPMVASFLCDLALAYVLAWLLPRVVQSGSRRAGALRLSILLSLAFVCGNLITSYGFEGRPRTLFLINGSFAVIGTALMGFILASWRGKAARQLESQARAASA